MLSSQEIIERSIYSSILTTLVSEGYCIDPEKYLPINSENSARFLSEKDSIVSSKGVFISLNGIGNNQSRGMKHMPSITIESQGFMPGDIGLPKSIIERVGDSYFVSEFPFETLDQFIDIHLIANKQEHMRLLHTMLFASIPQRGYIKPYNLEEKPFDGNIYIEVSNFYDIPNTDKGIMEKVYQFNVKDSLLSYQNTLDEPIVPINAIELLLESGYTGNIKGKDDKYFSDEDGNRIKGNLLENNKLNVKV